VLPEDRGHWLNIDGLIALAIKVICGVRYKPVNLTFILLVIHYLAEKKYQA